MAKAAQADIEHTDQDRIEALEQRVGTLIGALQLLLGPLQQLKKLNSLPTDAVQQAAKRVESLLQQQI